MKTRTIAWMVVAVVLMTGAVWAQRPSRETGPTMPAPAALAAVSSGAGITITVQGLGCTSKGTDTFDTLSFSWGSSTPTSIGTGTGLPSGKPSLSDVSIAKFFDSCSTALFQFAALGKQFPRLVLVQTDSMGNTTLEMVLSNVFVDSYQLGVASGGGNPTEAVSFAFKQLQVTGANGATTCFDVTTNTTACPKAAASPTFP